MQHIDKIWGGRNLEEFWPREQIFFKNFDSKDRKSSNCSAKHLPKFKCFAFLFLNKN